MKDNMISVQIMILLIISLVFINCGGGVDKTKDFAMLMDDRAFDVELGNPDATIRESDVGYTDSQYFKITFPHQHINPMKNLGFELQFDPGEVEIGEVMYFSAGDKNYKFRMEYYPALGHKMNQGIMLAYSSGMEEGLLEVRFDKLEPQIGGTVKGVILHAVMYGYYESNDTAEIEKADPPKKLEIFNFPFNAKFRLSPF